MVNIINSGKFVNRSKSKWNNNGFRSLFESIIPNEYITTLRDWVDNYTIDNSVLIGGMCMKYYGRPRYTENIDFLFLTDDVIPENVPKFKKVRPHGFIHIKTHVEIETITLNTIKSNVNFDIIYKNSLISDGVRIASPVSLIALKLDRFNKSDKDDIEFLYRYCVENNIPIDFSEYELSNKALLNYESIDKTLKFYENKMMLDLNYMLSTHRYTNLKIDGYDIVIFESSYGEPKFYFSNDIHRRISKLNDFKFGISLTKPFDGESIRLVESSNSYNNIVKYYSNENNFIVNYLDTNLEYLRSIWNELNPSRKI